MPPVILVAGSDSRSTSLHDPDLRIIHTTDGPTALSLAADRPFPSLVVFDLDLPGLDAFALCRQLKTHPPTQRVTVLLVSDRVVSPEDGVRALSAGADWCLGQQTTAPLLVESVKAMLRRRAEQARMEWEANEEHVRQAQKMEAIGHLAFGVAHDFNNLLTAILGYTEMMLSQIGDDKPISADLNEIRKAGDRAAALTGQLLRFSRKQPVTIAPVDLNLVVTESEQMLQRLIGEHIRLRTRLAADLWPVTGDPTQFEQVLLNLVVNARDAMPAGGGSVFVETTNVVLAAAHQFPAPVTVTPGRYSLLAVQDTGSGMDDATRLRLFEPFFTTKGRGSGTGLGLATVYGIVKHLNGYIFADSSPGHGTTFRLYFPAGVEAAVTVAAPMPRMHAFLGRETILVVEDDDAVRRYATLALRRYGYAVLEAESPERALQIAREHTEMIHLVLTDVIMPGLSGPAFVHRLRESRVATPAIFMSGYPGEMLAAATAEGDRTLAKPFATEELLRSVRQAIDDAHGTTH